MQKLILWDIDGTLLYSGGIAGICMRAAMERVYGRASEQSRHQYAGKTDRQIIIETFADRDPDELMARLDQFTEAYLAELENHRAEIRERGQVLAGVCAALARLAGEPVVQSALTGNLVSAARWKLEVMGLIQYFDLEVGAFGSDHHERVRLPAIAAARAERRFGRPLTGADLVVIGDTPNDIACGKAFGTRTVAVASGPFQVEELAVHQPDALLPSLADTETAIAAILGG